MASNLDAYDSQLAVRDAFFKVPELVLHMLTFLPTTSLITAMRVCKDLHGKIRDGGEFKKTLFLEASTPMATYKVPEGHAADHYYETRPPKPTDVVPTEPPYITNNPSGVGSWLHLCTPNLLFAHAEHCVDRLPRIQLRFRISPQELFDHYDRMHQSEQGRVWNQMLVCQPPAQTVVATFILEFESDRSDIQGYAYEYTDFGRVRHGRNTIDRQEGVRVIDVVQKVRGEVERTERERKSKAKFRANRLELGCRGVVDEFCPFVKEALDANMVTGTKPGDDLVPIWTDEVRTIREKDSREL